MVYSSDPSAPWHKQCKEYFLFVIYGIVFVQHLEEEHFIMGNNFFVKKQVFYYIMKNNPHETGSPPGNILFQILTHPQSDKT